MYNKFKRYSIFCGTNTLNEFFIVLKYLLLLRFKKHKKTIEKYQSIFSNFIGVKYAYSFASGRMALYSILMALDIGENDEIILPAYTCVVVPNSILYAKAKPVYVDIELNTFNIDPNRIIEKITPNTKAIYAQHTFGLPCNMNLIIKIAKQYKLYVIEDAAHALGAKYNDRMVGSLGDVSFFSTDHTKTINTHTGGIALTNNSEIAKKILLIQSNSNFLSTYNILKIIFTFITEYILYQPFLNYFFNIILKVFSKLNFFFFFHDENITTLPENYCYTSKLSSVQAAIGISQLNNIYKNLQWRKDISQNISQILSNEIFPYNEDASYLRCSFLTKNREIFINYFPTFKLDIWFTTIFHGRLNDFNLLYYHNGTCPNAEFVANHIVNFPTHLKINKAVLYKNIIEKKKYIIANKLNTNNERTS